MLDLDQRVADGLQELAGRAPVSAEVWPAAERYVAKRRRARRAVAGGALALVLVAGVLAAVGLTRDDGAKPTVATSGPAVGAFTIEAAPTGGLTYKPSAISVRTGLYDITLTNVSDAEHTLYFDDPDTRWPGLSLNRRGESKTARAFFGKPGDYTFYCRIPGHRAAGMKGVVHVTGDPVTLAQAETGAG